MQPLFYLVMMSNISLSTNERDQTNTLLDTGMLHGFEYIFGSVQPNKCHCGGLS